MKPTLEGFLEDAAEHHVWRVAVAYDNYLSRLAERDERAREELEERQRGYIEDK